MTQQFDEVARWNAREELRKMGDTDILAYIGDNYDLRQKLLQWVYAFNRIGAGIYREALDEDVIFEIWTPAWFEEKWNKFSPLVHQERTSRKGASGAYHYFEWLAKKKCPEVRAKYPSYKSSL